MVLGRHLHESVSQMNVMLIKLQELDNLVDELREEIVYTVSKTGGHLSSSLGVAELTVALHHVFNTPEDKIIWDVGHQVSCLGFAELLEFDKYNLLNFSVLSKSLNFMCLQTYPHKILTGRRSRMHTIRQTFGLAGFPKREESEHDAFGAGHSSTSISAALGNSNSFLFFHVTVTNANNPYEYLGGIKI